MSLACLSQAQAVDMGIGVLAIELLTSHHFEFKHAEGFPKSRVTPGPFQQALGPGAFCHSITAFYAWWPKLEKTSSEARTVARWHGHRAVTFTVYLSYTSKQPRARAARLCMHSSLSQALKRITSLTSLTSLSHEAHGESSVFLLSDTSSDTQPDIRRSTCRATGPWHIF
jgi:hypothetical protein